MQQNNDVHIFLKKNCLFFFWKQHNNIVASYRFINLFIFHMDVSRIDKILFDNKCKFKCTS
jgi:hypothetical protein